MDRADVLWQEWARALERIKHLEAENAELKQENEKLKSGNDVGKARQQ